MIIQPNKNEKRKRRHGSVRRNISGSAKTPRLNVYKSTNHIYAQIIDDTAGRTLVSASTIAKGVEAGSGTKSEQAKIVGLEVAKRAKKKGINKVIFDRGGYVYTGRVKALAEAAREGGLEF